MTRGVTDAVPLCDRLVAGWEVSRLGAMPLGLNLLIAGPMSVAVLALIIWLVLMGLELGRGLWTLHHPYASLRWLSAVSEAVGEDVAIHALAQLIRRYSHDPAYVVTRSDMAGAVRVERAARREAARRAKGFRFVEAPALPPTALDAPIMPSTNRFARISDEQRSRTRERCAARRARVQA